jgi:hypothetical protein
MLTSAHPETAQFQENCTWHGPRGLYPALWEDKLRKKESQQEIDKIKQLIGIELPVDDFELLKMKTRGNGQRGVPKQQRRLINTFEEIGYTHGAPYLQNLANRLFTRIELWLKTSVIAVLPCAQ